MGIAVSFGTAMGIFKSKIEKLSMDTQKISEKLSTIKSDTQASCKAMELANQTYTDNLLALNKANLDTITNLLDYRLKALETKQDKHNSVIERTVVMEQSIKELWQNVDTLNSVRGVTKRKHKDDPDS